jgi:uncharacterized protein
MAIATPGVYIREFEPAPPIQGIGTSTAAFLGAARSGPLVDPIEITSWDGFKATFGDQPIAGRYLWFAVKGFFENGGTTCYVVRITNASLATMKLIDANGKDTMVVTALSPGAAGDTIQVDVAAAHAITADVFQHSAGVNSIAGTDVTVNTADNALRFRPGDIVVLASDTSKRATVVSISGQVVRLNESLTAVGADTLQLATISHALGDTVMRLENLVGNASDLAPGTVVKVTQGANAEYATIGAVTAERLMLSGGTTITYRVVLTAPLKTDIDIPGAAAAVESEEFKLTVTGLDGVAVPYDNLAMNPASPNFYATKVTSKWVSLQPASPPTISLPPNDIPVQPAPNTLAGGQDENLSTIGPGDYERGLDTLVGHKDVNMVAIPDSQDPIVQGHLLDHCQNLADRFAIIDSILGAGVMGAGSVSDQEGSVGSQHGYAAIYYPWLLVEPAPAPPGAPAGPPAPNLLVPPSGHVAGIYARTDFERGVHKAPAGEGADVRGVIGLERRVSDTEQGILNLNFGVNVIRSFRPKGRPVVWGARTTATGLDTNWQYVNVRRLFLYLEGSIQAGIRYAVFEPNTEQLWAGLTQSLTAFLTQTWKDGALFGASPKEAFYVRIDSVLNPPSERQLGRLWIEIGVQPAYPAEFIIVRIGLWFGGSQMSEG